MGREERRVQGLDYWFCSPDRPNDQFNYFGKKTILIWNVTEGWKEPLILEWNYKSNFATFFVAEDLQLWLSTFPRAPNVIEHQEQNLK